MTVDGNGQISCRSHFSPWVPIFVILALFCCGRGECWAQFSAAPSSGPVVIQNGKPVAVQGARPAPSAKPQPNAKPNGNDKKDEKKDESKKDGEQEDGAASEVITRNDYPSTQGSMETIDLPLDADGKVTFNFQGVAWPPVLNWLARISGLSLDWQELPGDYLNLRTQQSYTATEARDLINRHLLSRGYTMLQHDELLTVAKIQNINPGLVPRVRPEELQDRMPHEFVKVSLRLEWLLAEAAVEELKPMLSPNGKLSPLKAVNRVEAMDAVINLREIYGLLTEEQSDDQREKGLVKRFQLKYVRASEVLPALNEMLGMDPPPSGSVDSSMGRQILQQIQQLQQRMQQAKGAAGGGGGGTEDKPRLIINERENSILAHAPPDKMEIIAETIAALDVPSPRDEHILQNINRMKRYRLSTLDPQPLVEILTDIGDLSPMTRIQVDEENSSLIVYGSLADHVTVQSLVERLDGSNRTFDVIQLRRLRADEVAGTIRYMLGSEEEEKKNTNSRYSYYGYYGYSSRNQQKKEDDRPFRVDADIENNRLMVWANEVELEEVQGLLMKMGEIPSGQSNPETMRVIDVNSDAEAAKLIEQIERIWKNSEPNQLDIQSSPAPNRTESDAEEESESSTPRAISKRPQTTPGAPRVPIKPATMQFAQLTADDQAPRHPLADRIDSAVPAPSESPSIVIQRLPDGKILLGSPDTRALDRLEGLIGEIAPPRQPYVVFQLKYPNTWAYDIEVILKDFFEGDGEESNIRDWYGNIVTMNEQGPSRLSNKKPLKIISDEITKTILVQGASPTQLRTIEELIDIYDQPESNDPQAIRETKMFHIKYSSAAQIADTVKSVYRDLLSSNDPSLQNGQGDKKQSAVERSYTYVYGNSGNKDSKEPEQPIKFKGLLSVGVDDVSNTIVVSAMSALMDDIDTLITTLDEAAMPTTRVQLIEMPASMNLSILKERLDGAFGQSASKVNVSTTQGPQKDKGPQNPNQQPNNQAVPQANGTN